MRVWVWVLFLPINFHSKRFYLSIFILFSFSIFLFSMFLPFDIFLIDQSRVNRRSINVLKQNIFIIMIILILVSDDFNNIVVKTIDNNLTSVTFYKENFESKLLKDTKDYYLHHIISYDETKPVISYLNRVSYTQ